MKTFLDAAFNNNQMEFINRKKEIELKKFFISNEMEIRTSLPCQTFIKAALLFME